MRVKIIADLKDPSDPEGRTYREVNKAKTHAFEVEQLVEIDNGVRMFIAKQTRDCDEEPLYSLAASKEECGDDFHMRSWLHGFSETGMKLVNY